MTFQIAAVLLFYGVCDSLSVPFPTADDFSCPSLVTAGGEPAKSCALEV